jgi:serine/threonine protein kinase
MSPEHKKDIKNLSYKSDIYSLGIIAYELITGKLCWGIVAKDNIPFYLRSIIMQCVEPRSENRYSDIVDLIQDLLDVLKSQEIETKINVPQGVLLYEENFLASLQKAFPTPTVNIDAIDCGISRSFHLKNGAAPCIFLENQDGSYCLGLYEAENNDIEKSLAEAKVFGFIETYQDFMSEKTFSFKHFIEKTNKFCINHGLKLKFSFIYINPYADEFISCHGGFLKPLLIKKSHSLPLEGAISNPLLGSTLDEMSFTSRFLEIGDQLLIHPVFDEKASEDLSSLFLNHSLYSSQNLVDTLIKKGGDLNIKTLICCVKVK